MLHSLSPRWYLGQGLIPQCSVLIGWFKHTSGGGGEDFPWALLHLGNPQHWRQGFFHWIELEWIESPITGEPSKLKTRFLAELIWSFVVLPGTFWFCGSSVPPTFQSPARLERGVSWLSYFPPSSNAIILYVYRRWRTTTITRDSAQHFFRRKSPILTW